MDQIIDRQTCNHRPDPIRRNIKADISTQIGQRPAQAAQPKTGGHKPQARHSGSDQTISDQTYHFKQNRVRVNIQAQTGEAQLQTRDLKSDQPEFGYLV